MNLVRTILSIFENTPIQLLITGGALVFLVTFFVLFFLLPSSWHWIRL